MARMCVPVDDDVSAARLGWEPADGPARLRLVAETYGLDRPERREVLEILADSIARGGEFMVRRVQASDPNFTRLWQEMGGMRRFDRRREWWAEHEERFIPRSADYRLVFLAASW